MQLFPLPLRARPLSAMVPAGLVVVLTGCASRSTTCAWVRSDGGTDLIDIKGGSCSDFVNSQQGYTSCSPVVVFNTIMGPTLSATGEAAPELPSLDQPWRDAHLADVTGRQFAGWARGWPGGD